MTFVVGDIITGNETNGYPITRRGATMKVVGVLQRALLPRYIEVIMLDGADRGRTFTVMASKFKLVERKTHKVNYLWGDDHE